MLWNSGLSGADFADAVEAAEAFAFAAVPTPTAAGMIAALACTATMRRRRAA